MDLLARLLRSQGRDAEADQLTRDAAKIRQAAAAIDGYTLRRADMPGEFRVGGGVSAPKLEHKVEPEYTVLARAAKYQGSVVLSIEIGPDGLAHNVRVKQGLGLGLDERAVEAIGQWKFQPAMKDGQPVTVAATIEVNFKLL